MVRRIGLGLALALAGLVLLLVLALGFAQTGPGQRLAEAAVERALSGPDTRAEVEGLRGTVPFDMALGRVVLIGPEGPWLHIADARLDWSPGALLRGRLQVDELSARRIEVLRPPPDTAEEEPPEPVRLPELPDALFPATIERLLVDELFVAEEVLGRAATFRLAGGLDTGPAGEVATLALELERTDEPSAQARVDARLELQPAALEIAASASETGELLAALTGRPEAGDFRLEVTGSGPLDAWRGHLEATAENLLRAEAEVAIDAVDEPRLAFDLALEPAPGLLPEDLAPLLGERVSVVARVRQPAAQELVVERLRAEMAQAELRGEGRFDFEADELGFDAALEVADLAPLRAIVEMPLGGAMRVALHAEGTVLQPAGHLELTFTDFAAADMRAARIRTVADWRVLAPLTRTLAMSVDGEGTARGVDLATRPPLPVEDWSWQFRAGAPADGPLQLEDFTLTGGPIRLAATGELDPDSQAAALDLALDVSDVAQLTEALGQPIGGRAELRAALRVPEGGDRLEADLSGALDELQGLPPGAAELLGARVRLTASGLWNPDIRVQASELELDAAHLQLTGDMGLDLPQQTLGGNLLLTLPELEALEPVLEQTIAGSLRLAATLGGTLDAPDVLLEGQSPELLIADQALRDVALRLTAADLLEAPAGSLRLALTAMGLATSLEAGYRLEGEQLGITDLVLQIPDGRAEGALSVDLAANLVDGRLEGQVQELSRLDPLLPMRPRGELEFDLRLTPENGTQTAALVLDTQELRTDVGEIQRAGLRASVSDALGEPQIQASLDVAGARQEDLRLDRGQLEASGTLGALALTATLEGEVAAPFSLQTAGEVALGEAIGVRLAELSGEVAGEPLRLLAPTQARLADQTIELEPLRLSWAEAEIAAELVMAPDQVAADLRVEQLPLAVLTRFGAPDLSGRASAALALSGSPADPRAELEIELADLTSPEAALAELPPIQITATAQLGAERLSTEVRASGVTATPMLLTASLPARVQLQPFTFELPPDGTLEGQFAAQMNLARIDDLIGLDDQRLRGDLTVDLTLTGTVAEPDVGGTIAVDEGLYENGTTGTVLRQVTLRADASRQQIVIRELSATDGGGGRLTGEGALSIDADANYPYELELQVRGARLVRREDVDATLGGQVALDGDLEGAEITGRIRVQRAEISIAETPGPRIAVLEVEEVGGPGGPANGVGGPADAIEPPFQMGLDIRVDIPSQAFVRGRGLDSEWQGELTLTGTMENPSIVGVLTIRRGHFDFLDRRFDLREGQIEFTGDSPPVPFIYLEAVATAQDITAIIRLEGPMTAPSITMDSEPSMPQDEVLARLLFNRELSELGPTDAVRLASALNRLRSGQGFDVFAQLRNVVGLDVLDIVGGTEDGVVRAGRYLGDDVYLEVERGLAEGTGRARVEIEIAPNVALEAETGGGADTGVGLKWKYDF